MKVTMPILTEKDIQIRCRDMANELRDHAFLVANRCLNTGALSERLNSLASSLTEMANYLDERHSNG
jgi:hypothetical protein